MTKNGKARRGNKGLEGGTTRRINTRDGIGREKTGERA